MQKLLFFLFSIFLIQNSNGQTVYFEDFDSTSGTSLPAGWTQASKASDGGFLSGTELSLSSSEFPIEPGTGRFVATNDDACNCNKSDDFLISPYIPLDTLASNFFLQMSVFFVKGQIGAKQEKAFLEVSADSGLTWKVMGQFGASLKWQDITVNLSEFAGKKGIQLGFRYNDDGGWLFGLGLDNIRLYMPPVNEVRLLGFSMDEYVMMGDVPVKGVIFNGGSDTLRSLHVEYQVEDENIVREKVENINLAPLSAVQLVHPVKWNIQTPGIYNLRFKVELPNDFADFDSTNNEGNSSTIVATNTAIRTTLVEEFTSSTCTPCSLYNQFFIPILMDDYGANTADSRVAAIAYHMNFPAPGNDPSFNSDAESRAEACSISSTPSMFADGKSFYSNPRTSIANAFNKPSPMKIDMETIFRNDSLITELTITPYIPKPAGLRLFVGLTEDYYEYNGYNGELEFIHVMRKLLPNANGKALPALVPNEPITYKTGYPMVSGNVTKGSFNFWGNSIAGVTSIAWVQDMAGSKHVYQAAIDESITLGEPGQPEAFPAKFFPNPGNGTVFIQAGIPSAAPVNLEVYNLIGQRQFSESYGFRPAGEQLFQANLNQLPDGVYLIKLRVAEKQVVRKISIVH